MKHVTYLTREIKSFFKTKAPKTFMRVAVFEASISNCVELIGLKDKWHFMSYSTFRAKKY